MSGADEYVDVELPLVVRCTRAGIPHTVQVVKREMELQFEHTYLLDDRIVIRPQIERRNLNDAPRAQ